MPKKTSTERGYMTKKEIYSHLDGLKTVEGKAKYLNVILSKKGLLSPETYKTVQESANDIYGKVATFAAREGRFGVAGEFAEKMGNKKLAGEMHKKEALKAAKKGWFDDVEGFAEKIKDKKLADGIYKKAALKAIEKGEFGDAGELIDKIKDKKLAGEIYWKAIVKSVERKTYSSSGEFEEKGKEYLKQNNPDILAKIYEETGEVIKAKDLRKRLEAKGKKK